MGMFVSNVSKYYDFSVPIEQRCELLRLYSVGSGRMT